MRFDKLKIGDKFVCVGPGFLLRTKHLALVAFEKKSLSSAYILESESLVRTSCAAYWNKTYTRFGGAVEVHPLV